MKLRNHPSSQCHVTVYDSGNIKFTSYATDVIFVKYIDGKRYIECTGTYSATTRRQIGWFLKEYIPELTYQDMKAIVGKGYVEL